MPTDPSRPNSGLLVNPLTAHDTSMAELQTLRGPPHSVKPHIHHVTNMIPHELLPSYLQCMVWTVYYVCGNWTLSDLSNFTLHDSPALGLRDWFLAHSWMCHLHQHHLTLPPGSQMYPHPTHLSSLPSFMIHSFPAPWAQRDFSLIQTSEHLQCPV